MTAAGPPLIWWGIPGASGVYVLALAALSALALCALGLVSRDAILRRSAGHRGLPGSDVLLRGVPLLLLIGAPATARAQAGVYLTERQALQEVFPNARWIATDTIRPDDSTRAALEQRLGRPIETEFVFRRIYEAAAGDRQRGTGNGQRLSGYTLVTEEKGKYRPITMLVGVDTQGRVAGVRILVYREPRGGEVARQFFLRQYRGKDVGDPIRMNRDIINISGATISVNSVNAAVRKTLALVERHFSPAADRPPDPLAPVSELP
jgi:Na+-translocating ferredoxin:NAD+ oxidoreductase RnfG subunit